MFIRPLPVVRFQGYDEQHQILRTHTPWDIVDRLTDAHTFSTELKERFNQAHVQPKSVSDDDRAAFYLSEGAAYRQDLEKALVSSLQKGQVSSNVLAYLADYEPETVELREALVNHPVLKRRQAPGILDVTG